MVVRCTFSFSFIAIFHFTSKMVVKPTSCMHLPRERKDTKRKRNHAAVYYALTGIEGFLSKTPVVYRQAGSLTLTIRAHALRSRRALRYTVLPTYVLGAFPRPLWERVRVRGSSCIFRHQNSFRH